jgi:hypothetical protein
MPTDQEKLDYLNEIVRTRGYAHGSHRLLANHDLDALKNPDRVCDSLRPDRLRLRCEPAAPSGNITGFMLQAAGMAGKWLELLTKIAPAVRRAALMFNPDTAPFVRSFYLPLFEAAARSLKLVPIAAPVHSNAEIDTVIGSAADALDLTAGPELATVTVIFLDSAWSTGRRRGALV